MAYVKLVGSSNPNTNWTTEVVLEKDDEGNPTKVVRAGEPVDLSGEQQKRLEQEFGLKFEKSSKQEADEAEQEAPLVGADVAGAAPRLEGSEGANQTKTDKK